MLSTLSSQGQQRLFFLIGLVGIVATGLILGMGGENYWALANGNPPFGTEPFGSHPGVLSKGILLFLILGVYVFLSDLIAFGVIFAGSVLVVQRLRGRI
jgi:uncharacterized membrane protein YjgN (DUF898 family)